MLTYAMIMVQNYLATLKQEEGQGMAEYGLILAGVAILVIGAVFALGGRVEGLFDSLDFTNPGS
jgi:pilus assembly protein Flp/PilA